MEVTLRNITPEDAPIVAQIYAHYIRHTVATFHETPKSVDGYLQQIKELSAVYPFLVAEADGHFLGFANAEPFRPQSGYRYTAELTIYLHPDAPKHSGIGRKLYTALLTQLKELHYVNVLACISGENESSIAFHRSFGFEEMAVFPKVAYKHDRWLDAVWMRKTLLSTEHSPEEPMRVNI